MGAGYEVGVFNAGASTVTVTPAGSDTINALSASITLPIKSTVIFRTNQALTGYNVIGQSNRMDAGTVNGATVGAITPASGAFTTLTATTSAQWGTGTANFGVIIKRKTADETVTSSAVLQDDDHLTFSIAANEEWIGSIWLNVSEPVVGVKTALTFPAGATLSADGFLAGNAATVIGRSTTSGGTIFTGTGIANDIGLIYFWVLNGATPGSITLQWAQTSSNGTGTTVSKGSWLQATRVA